jgi:hypothetical protein
LQHGPESQRLSAQQAAEPRSVFEWLANLRSRVHRPPLQNHIDLLPMPGDLCPITPGSVMMERSLTGDFEFIEESGEEP